jgi:hypothetical protein
VLKLGGVQASKSYSDHTMAGKQLPCLGIARDGGVAHVHHRVLDVGVPQPILHECHIRTGVQEMHRDRVTQRMKTPLGLRLSLNLSLFVAAQNRAK